MTASKTSKLSLPFLQPGQALKTITHNEALHRLDTGLYLSCADMAAETLPDTPEAGHTVILSESLDSDNAGDIAVFNNGSWLWFRPLPGWTIWDSPAQTLRVYDGQNWLGPGTSPISQTLSHLGLNCSATEEQRLAVASSTSLFSHEGSGHRILVNRAAESETASLIFQTDYSGNAELGLNGPAGLSLKTSVDGENWNEKLSAPNDYSGVRSPAFGSQRLPIENDSAEWIETPATGGIFAITIVNDNGLPLANRSGLFAYDTGSTPSLISLAKTGLIENHGTMVLDGSISDAGHLGLSAGNGGLYAENRINGRRHISLTFLC